MDSQRMEVFFNESPAAMYEIDLQTNRFVRVNEAWCGLTGYSREELLEMNPGDLLDEEGQRILQERTGKLLRHEQISPTHEYQVVTKGGRKIWCLVSTSFHAAPDGSKLATVVAFDITYTKETENELSRNVELLNNIFEASPDAIIEIDLKGDIRHANCRAMELLGLDPEMKTEPLNANLRDFVVESQQQEVEDHISRIINTGSSRNKQFTLIRPDGTSFLAECSASLIHDDNGNPMGFVSVLRDITTSKQAEKALRESEERYRSIVERSRDGFIIVVDEKVIFANKQMLEIAGYDTKEFTGGHFIENVYPDDRPMITDRYLRRMQGEDVPSRYEVRILRKDGTPLYVELNAELITYQGQPANFVIIRDISERKNAERLQSAVYSISQATDTTKSLEELYAAVHNHIQEVMPADNFYIALYDEVNDLLSFPYFVDSVDQQPAPKRPGKGMTEYVLRTGKSVLADWPKVMELVKQDEVEVIGEDSPIWLGVPLIVDQKTIGVMVVQHYSDPDAYTEREQQVLEFVSTQVARAIEHKMAEMALLESEELNRGIVENAPVGVVYLDGNGAILFANRQMHGIAGKGRDDSFGYESDHLSDIQQIIEEACDKVVELVLAGDTITSYKIDYTPREGSAKVLEINAAPRLDVEGNLIGAVLLFKDLTSYKELEDQLLRSQRMEAVGRLAGGIAHDFNNLLTAITGNAELALLSLDSEDPVARDLEEILKTSDRAADLTRQLLTFSRKQIISPKVINLNRVLNDMERMLHRIIGEDIELSTSINSDLWSIKADPVQIEQVIVNLAVNARDAMPGGGVLHLKTSNITVDKNLRNLAPGLSEDEYVLISMNDTGMGIDTEVMTKIFEPFFTTKKEGRGTGLGLSTVYGIVKQSGGEIRVESLLDKGTTFNIYLPRYNGPETEETASLDTTDAPRGDETVLIVEDEQPVRELTERTLKRFGYTVITAENGDKALAVVNQREQPVDLVLSDVIMPQMNGPEFAEALEKIWPDVRVTFMSGYTDNAILPEALAESKTPFIQKPFRPVELARFIRKALDN